MAVRQRPFPNPRPPFDRETLEQAALRYAGRYATTRSKLTAYLHRKLEERGWGEEGDPPVARLVERMSELGYVDDRAFARARAAALGRRGYGERRVRVALQVAGVEPEDREEAEQESQDTAFESALRFARRKRIGPFAEEKPDRAGREKALGAMLRAGHPMAIARRLVDSAPGDVPEPDDY